MNRVRPLTDFLRSLFGPTVWAGHFFALYAAQSLLCTTGADPTRYVWFAAIATATSIALLVGVLAWPFVRRRTAERLTAASVFLLDIATALAWLSLLGVLWNAFPVAFLPVCAEPLG
jgi:hypothetical protein